MYLLLLSDCNDTYFLDKFSKQKKKALISSFITTSLVGTELFHADGQTDMKLIVASRNSANVPNKTIPTCFGA